MRDQRPEVGARGEGIADPDARHEGGGLLDERVVEGPLHVRARGGRAVLPGVDERTGDGSVDGGVEIRVVEDHEGCLAAQLQVEALDGGGRDLGNALADGGGPREGRHGHVRVTDEMLAGDLPRAGDDVDDTVWDAGLGGGLREHQRGERGQLGGLQDDRVARGDRREDLPGGHLEGIVPGRDGADDADGFTAYVRRVVAGVLTGGLPLQVPCGTGEEGRVVNRSRDVELTGELQRLAALEGLGAGEVVRALGEYGGETVQRVGALAGRGPRPARERGARGGHGGVHVVGPGQLVRVDVLAGGRVDDGVGVT